MPHRSTAAPRVALTRRSHRCTVCDVRPVVVVCARVFFFFCRFDALSPRPHKYSFMQAGGATVAQPYNGPVAQQAVVGQAGNHGGGQHVVVVRQGHGGAGVCVCVKTLAVFWPDFLLCFVKKKKMLYVYGILLYFVHVKT